MFELCTVEQNQKLCTYASGQNLKSLCNLKNLKSGQLFISFPEGLEDTPLKDSPSVSLDFGRLASKFKSGNAISLETTREVPNWNWKRFRIFQFFSLLQFFLFSTSLSIYGKVIGIFVAILKQSNLRLCLYSFFVITFHFFLKKLRIFERKQFVTLYMFFLW